MKELIPGRLCACGCGGLTSPAKFPCKQREYIKNHHLRKKDSDRYSVDAETGCWIWKRSLTPQGYGLVSTRNEDGTLSYFGAHKWLYEKYNGKVPEGMQLDHLCRNRRCCNPDHLEVVTPAVNQQRGCRAKLNADKVREIRALHAEGSCSLSHLGRVYNVPVQSIWKIVRHLAWKNVA